jgi:hypothetical protein
MVEIPGEIPGAKQPADVFDRNLHPNMLAGVNDSKLGPLPSKTGRTLYDYKDMQRRFRWLTDDEMKRIPVIPEGSRLEQGATYIDLRDEHPREFKATAEMVAGPNNLYVPKSDVDYVLWNRLRGVNDPRRLDQGD